MARGSLEESRVPLVLLKGQYMIKSPICIARGYLAFKAFRIRASIIR